MVKNLKQTFIPFALFGVFFFFGDRTAQAQDVLDGAYIEEHTPTRQVIRHTHLREADVMWSRRIWRNIEVKQKFNLPLFYPLDEIEDRKSLFQVMKHGIIEEGSITAYDPGPDGQDDEFTVPFTASQVKALLTDSVQDQIPMMGGGMKDTFYVEKVTSRNVKRYSLKEVWYFDKQRSVMDVKIIGIAPWKENIEGGEVQGYSILFWLYFPECRYVFQNYNFFNMGRQNKSQMRSFDDLFAKRRFDSYITKESNVYDRRIQMYKKGLDALLEAKKIKNEMFRIEHDLWSY